jgi:site-specific DNA-cytosine methylase
MIYLSLFGGMECGRIALDLMGESVTKYYSSEIDKYAIAEVKTNYPDVIQLGDITQWRTWLIDWWDIELVFGGSPCQGFSFAGKQLAFDDPRSVLFFVYIDILNHVKSMRKIVYNLDVDFMLENVKMKKQSLAVITDYMGVNGTFINSSLVSAQNRQRWYWSNWDISQPTDRELYLVDILESNPLSFTLMSDTFVKRQKGRSCLRDDFSGKAVSLSAMEYVKNGRQGDYIKCGHYSYRKLTVIECCRLMGVPDDYFKVSSNTQAYKMLGNGWQIDTIIHILKERLTSDISKNIDIS